MSNLILSFDHKLHPVLKRVVLIVSKQIWSFAILNTTLHYANSGCEKILKEYFKITDEVDLMFKMRKKYACFRQAVFDKNKFDIINST
ncbi:hypothetical protein BpHYR1_025505, partial [Brachionus plicatilis]